MPGPGCTWCRVGITCCDTSFREGVAGAGHPEVGDGGAGSRGGNTHGVCKAGEVEAATQTQKVRQAAGVCWRPRVAAGDTLAVGAGRLGSDERHQLPAGLWDSKAELDFGTELFSQDLSPFLPTQGPGCLRTAVQSQEGSTSCGIQSRREARFTPALRADVGKS